MPITMTLTSAQANQELKKLYEKRDTLIKTEKERCLFVAAIQENPDDVRPQYSFQATQDNIEAIEAQIRAIKHALNIFNSTTTIPEFGMTIDELLVYMPQLTARKTRLADMKDRMPKTRDRMRPATASIIDYVYTNYNICDAEKQYNHIAETLAKAQVALDTINNSMTFEVTLNPCAPGETPD